MDQLPQFTKGATSYTHPSPGGSVQFSVVAQLCPTLCDPTPQLFGLQHTRLPCPSPTSESAQTHVIESVMPSISSCLILSSCLQSFPASGSFPMSQFSSSGQSVGASASASVFQWTSRTDFLWDWLVWSPCSPRDSQESSPTPQSTNSSGLSLLYGPTLTSIHDHCKNHSFDYYGPLLTK